MVHKTTISRFCGLLLFKEMNGKPYVLLLPSHGRLKIGGGMQEEEDASPEAAMSRESEEEFGVRPVDPEAQGDYPDPNDPLNLRAFWNACDWEGEIRTEPKLIENEWIEAPIWVELTRELISDFRPKIVYSHLLPLKKGILWAMMRFPSFGYFAMENKLAA